MTRQPFFPKTELPIWTGRRGVVNTVVCCVLAALCAFALWALAERSTIVPACTAYGQAHEMTYVDFKVYNSRRASGATCMFNEINGRKTDVALSEMVPFLTDTWVGFALKLEITFPAFAIFFALARAVLHVLGTRRQTPTGTT